MVLMYPVGIPLCYACVLWHFRDLINPPGCSDELHAMRVRNQAKISRPELQAIDFLFSCYRPSAWWFEVFDSLRRVASTGLIRYVRKTSGPPIAGILISLVSFIVFREVQPYEVSIALLTCSVFFCYHTDFLVVSRCCTRTPRPTPCRPLQSGNLCQRICWLMLCWLN